MKKILLLCMLFPVFAVAQDNSGMSPETMKMMEQAQQAQVCMQEIDIGALEKIGEQGKKKEAEIKSLCAGGKRDQAQKEALAFSREVMSSDAMKQMRKCSEMLRGILPKMPFDNFEEEFANKHICDEM